MKVFLFSSALLAVAVADTCSDCTAVVSTIAALLWPGYWDPNGEWMCAPICEAPEDVDMTCDDCKMGIQAAIDQMLSPEAMDIIVEGISAEICKDNPTPECPVAVDGLLRAGLPVLAAMADDAGFEQACNAAVENTCAARKLRLF